VQHTDVFPSLLELLGEKPTARVTGESFISSVEGGGTGPESIITGWSEHASFRTPEWNYIVQWRGGEFEELYDVRKDPEELRNVTAQHPQLTAEFRRKVMAHVDAGWTMTKGTFAKTVES
jgi:arylsulfatase A-like enzyme